MQRAVTWTRALLLLNVIISVGTGVIGVIMGTVYAVIGTPTDLERHWPILKVMQVSSIIASIAGSAYDLAIYFMLGILLRWHVATTTPRNAIFLSTKRGGFEKWGAFLQWALVLECLISFASSTIWTIWPLLRDIQPNAPEPIDWLANGFYLFRNLVGLSGPFAILLAIGMLVRLARRLPEHSPSSAD